MRWHCLYGQLHDTWSSARPIVQKLSKNDRNEEVLMRIIEEKANKLLNELSFITDSREKAPPSLRMAEQLPRVQPLFIYQFICLFDGDIRQRAQAEALIPTLKD